MGMIDARGSFLHFNDFKEIQKWNVMQAIVRNIQKNLTPFRDENLSGIEKLHRDEALLEFNQQAANQFDARIKEEGRNLIRNIKALINNAVEDFGQQVKFNSTQTNQLEQLVNSFNEAIKGGQSTVNYQNPGFKRSLKENSGCHLTTLATEGNVVNYDVVASLIVVKLHGIKRTIKNALNNLADVVSVRSDATRKVLEELASEINDFNLIEKYFRLEMCKILSQNMEEWHSVQKKNSKLSKQVSQPLRRRLQLFARKLGERVRHDPLGAYTKFGKKDHNTVCEHLTNLEILTRRVFQEECKTKITTLVDGKFRESKQTINEIETRLTSEIVSVWSLGQKSTIKVMFEKSRDNTAYNYVKI
ncbi:2_t:CDS:2 [Ambispora gerdemannii]|uniref:2_t:CDS:1 n=1 Tax=Ambispora gerdemannii TaxID=144530 RepID=A0A9N9G406_9GLOM|nr:2_t:CDS:2 [Ambispora gerdemannii]